MATSAKNWKKPGTSELDLPSGNTCLVRRPGMEALLQAGVMPDSLTPIIMESLKESKAGPQDHKKKGEPVAEGLNEEQMEKLLEDPNALNDIFSAFDKVCVMVVVEPEVRYHMVEERDSSGNPRRDTKGNPVWVTIPPKDRDEDVLYTDEVDSDDKEFIFQYVVGGDDDLESFRARKSPSMGDV